VQHLFEPFLTTEAQGTGLGLYLARELCHANGATLRYEPGPRDARSFRDRSAPVRAGDRPMSDAALPAPRPPAARAPAGAARSGRRRRGGSARAARSHAQPHGTGCRLRGRLDPGPPAARPA
jgi:signal transduction histidine kinase